MRTMNIRIYKVELPNGATTFGIRTQEEAEGNTSNSLESMAMAAHVLQKQAENQERTLVSIDLKPFHDIELSSGLPPRRNYPLSKAEILTFWSHFKFL